jgi:hypothetical protein
LNILVNIPDSPLALRIGNHLDDYVKIITDPEEKITDSKEAATKILSDPKIKPENKKKYIELYQNQNLILAEIPDKAPWELWGDILSNNRAEFSPQNIYDYFRNKGMDERLCEFINKNKTGLTDEFSFDEIITDVNEKKRFTEAIVRCSNMDNDAYSALIKSLKCEVDCDVFAVPMDKFERLISIEVDGAPALSDSVTVTNSIKRDPEKLACYVANRPEFAGSLRHNDIDQILKSSKHRDRAIVAINRDDGPLQLDVLTHLRSKIPKDVEDAGNEK